MYGETSRLIIENNSQILWGNSSMTINYPNDTVAYVLNGTIHTYCQPVGIDILINKLTVIEVMLAICTACLILMALNMYFGKKDV